MARKNNVEPEKVTHNIMAAYDFTKYSEIAVESYIDSELKKKENFF